MLAHRLHDMPNLLLWRMDTLRFRYVDGVRENRLVAQISSDAVVVGPDHSHPAAMEFRRCIGNALRMACDYIYEHAVVN